MSNVRYAYNQILVGAYTTRGFADRMAILLDSDPYFTPAFLEMYWLAKRNDDAQYQGALRDYYIPKRDALFFNAETRAHVSESWTDLELKSLKLILTLFSQENRSLYNRLKAKLQLATVDHFFSLNQHVWEGDGQYLRKEITIENLEALQQELAAAAPYWWGIDTDRSKITHHQHTRTVALRYLPTNSVPYAPVDGVHESVEANAAKKFPQLHQTILDFAKKQNLALGRIAIVVLSPGQQAYRHYDHEDYLEHRNRYHLVLHAGEQNILTSGTDEVDARPGELWFFNNHVMHRAHNFSDQERVHVIFDGYQLSADSDKV